MPPLPHPCILKALCLLTVPLDHAPSQRHGAHISIVGGGELNW